MAIIDAIRALSLLPLITAASCAGGSASAYGRAPGTAENFADVDVHLFIDHLEPYGRWIEVREHGRCWRPYDVTPEWRPYTIGRWAYTDYGWTWYSLEPWGWATYHYGRWILLPDHGWVWVPGRVWGPAWVVWRYGDGFIGWAPLPPTPYFRHRIEVVEAELGLVTDEWFCFIEVGHFHHPYLHRHVIPRERHVTIVTKTTRAVRIEKVEAKVVNRGVDVVEIERVTGRKVERVRVRDVGGPDRFRDASERERRREESFRDDRDGDRDRDSRDVPVYRPRVAREGLGDRFRDEQYASERRRLSESYERQRQEMQERHERERARVPDRTSEAQAIRRQELERRQTSEKHRKEIAEARRRRPVAPSRRDSGKR